jgi:FAD/FMN-containing dehydrogenase
MTMAVQEAAPAIHKAVVQDFRGSLRGELLQPGDEGYDVARVVWNGMIDRRPALIVRARGAADVIAAVNFAREHDLILAVRGGGHNVAGNAVCDNGLMLDLSLMKGIRVDAEARTARAEPGVLWGELDRETQAFGLATTGGTVSATGIAGLTLGGGVGWLAGKYGMAIDNLLSVDVVTADGVLRHASDTENPELLWAIRGAGANFGVVTSFEYRLHPVGPMILGGLVLHPFERAAEVLRFYRDFAVSQPDELTTYAAVLTGPDGGRVIALATCYAGDAAEGERVLAPLKAHGAPLADMIGPMPYVAQQTMLDAAFPYGRQNYWKSVFAKRISDEAIDAIVEFGADIPSPYSVIVIQDVHGAAARVSPTATAFSHRDAPHAIIALANWVDPADTERNITWARGLFAAVEPHAATAVYVNDLGHDESRERVASAYGANHERLVQLKARYDPTNLFRMNQNIRPEGT